MQSSRAHVMAFGIVSDATGAGSVEAQRERASLPQPTIPA